MQHLVVKAASATTDRGTFTAIAAAWSLDRQNERIAKGAFADTIAAWKASGKRLPLHWNHSEAASDVIGYVDPAEMRESDEGLVVRGQLDLEDSEVAREAWRSMKNNAIGLSFGYMTTDSYNDDDGVRVLTGVDLFEITLTPTPANADTRITGMKSADNQHTRVHREYHDLMLAATADVRHSKDLDDLQADFERVTKGIDLRPPIRIASFEA